MKKSLLSLALALVLALAAFSMPGLAEGDPVELRAVASLHTSTLDLETLPIYIEIAEKANVKITWEYYRTDYDTKKQLILASGDLPDFFFGRYALTVNDIQMNLESFIPLEELVEQYAPNIQRMYEEFPVTKTINIFPDGHTYSIPHYMPARPVHLGSMFINQAWLDKLGLETPTTIDELNEVARRFVEDDPNGNGKQDEMGYAFSSLNDANFGARVFIGAFGVHDSLDSWLALDEDKNVIYNPATENYKDYISWLSYLYAEGLMDREMLTHDFAQYKAKTRRSEEEISGIQCGWEISQMGNPNYNMLMPVVGPNGHQIVSGNTIMNKLGSNTYCTFSITTACENPEAVMRWVDYFFTDEYGMQSYYGTYGVSIRVNDDGTLSRIAAEGTSLDSWSWTNGMSDNFVGYVSAEVEAKLVFDDEWSLKGLGKLDFDKAYTPYIDESYVFPSTILPSDDAEDASTISADLDSIRDTFAAKWVSEGGIDEEWDAYLAELERAGLSRYLEIYQNAYDAKN